MDYIHFEEIVEHLGRCGIIEEALHTWEANQHTIIKADINQAIRHVYEQGRSVLPWTALPLLQQPLDNCLKLPMTAK